MKVDVYKSSKSQKYLFVPAGKNITELSISDDDMKEVSIFKNGIELDVNKPRISLDPKTAITKIESYGYYIQG